MELSDSQQTLEQCVTGESGPQDSGLQQGLGYVDQGTTALEGTSEAAAQSSAVAVGKTFAAATLMTVPGNEGYTTLGEEVQSAAESALPYLRGADYILGGASVAADALSGYNADGVTGLVSGATYGALDFAVEAALSAGGPIGAVAAVGYSEMGGSKTIIGATGRTMMCSAKFHIPPPMIFRQVR